jgi:hypothetical protein
MRKTLILLSFATMFAMLAPAAFAQDTGLPGPPIDRSTHITFSGPVALPTVTLPAGTYLFRFIDWSHSNVLQVLSDDGKTPYAMINTIPIERTREAAEKGEVVTFKESPSETPAKIDAWFFDGTDGCEMVE